MFDTEADIDVAEYLQTKQDKIAQDLFLNGETDAASGISPRITDQAYLDGYLNRLRALIVEMLETGRRLQIRWADPPAFAFGYMDGPGDCIDGESNLF